MAKKKDSPFHRIAGHGLRSAGSGLRELEHKREFKPKPGSSVYETRRWRKLSARIRKERGRCEQCGSTEQLSVDHIIPLFKFPPHPERYEKAWSEDNLMVMCPSCHAVKDAAARKEHKDELFRDELASKLDWME